MWGEMHMPELQKGIPEEAKQNPWVANNVLPDVVDARYFVDTSGLTVAVFKIHSKSRGEEYLFIAKFARNGYMKARMKLRPGDAEALASAIRELLP